MPEAASQRRMVWSSEAESSFVPSGEKAQDVTELECPWRVRRQLPEAASQRRMVWSYEAESSFVPSGEKAQDVTGAGMSLESEETVA